MEIPLQRLLWLALGLAGCGATTNRPLIETREAAAITALLRERHSAALPTAPPVLAVMVTPIQGARFTPWPTGARAALPGTRIPSEASEPAVGDDAGFMEPGSGPVRAGLPIELDFGVGEAPYDDGTTPTHRGATGPGGFSDTVLSLAWRQPVAAGLSVLARAALTRDQDLAILEGLPEADFAFAVLGVAVSF